MAFSRQWLQMRSSWRHILDVSIGPLSQQTVNFDVLSLTVWVKLRVIGAYVVTSMTDTLWAWRQC